MMALETHMMPPLVLRLYEQTKDAHTKTRCLKPHRSNDRVDFGSIQTELVKVERLGSSGRRAQPLPKTETP